MRHIFRTVVVAATLLVAAAHADVERPARVVSLNVCTDQLLLALADPDQIAGLSRFALSPDISYFADRAAEYPILRGGAEDVLLIDPDLVLAGTFTSRSTREILAAAGYPVEAVAPARSIADGKEQIARIAALLGHPDRGAELVRRIEAAERAARESPALDASAVYYQRRGFVSGAESLMTELFAIVGLENAAGRLGRNRTGPVRLESIVATPPDILVVSDTRPAAEDQGLALILHPALADAVPEDRRIAVPERLTICGGPSLPEAIGTLAEGVARIAAP